LFCLRVVPLLVASGCPFVFWSFVVAGCPCFPVSPLLSLLRIMFVCV
jgi:hypothetical protein